MTLPITTPLRPMLAKATARLPEGDGWWYEPKWDGFRCIVVRDGDEVGLDSRNERPLTRYFPELLDPLRNALPDRCILDGEVVVVTPNGLDFDLLGQRIHPAESRVRRLSVETPASYVAFDLIALGDESLLDVAFRDRRTRLEELLAGVPAPIHLCPISDDPAVGADWFTRFEGAGFDGVIAKRAESTYQPNVRAMAKVKHQRTADVVVAGYRIHKDGNGVGSLLLGLFDDEGSLHHIGVASSFDVAARRRLLDEVAPYETDALATHPWRGWAEQSADSPSAQRMPGAPSRWSGQKELDWVPLRCELVCEIGYQGLTHGRLRHPGKFLRWRPDRDPSSCRYDQLDQVAPAELAAVFGPTGTR